MKELMNKIENKCEAITDYVYEHENAFAVGYVGFAIAISIVSMVMYGKRTKAIKAGAILRKGDLYM